jgi:hypothetical protein
VKKLIIESKTVKGILESLEGGATEILDVLNKAIGHKYIRRWPDPNHPKKWRYLYPSDFLHPIKALFNLFSFKKEKLDDDYSKNNIQKDYGADKKTFAAHIIEYFSNKLKWDGFFAKKENRDKYKKPQKATGKPAKKTGGATGAGTGTGAAGPGDAMGDPAGALGKNGKKGVDGGGKKGDNKSVAVNKSLMRKVWGIYSGKDGKDGENNTNAGQGKLPVGTPAVRAGGSEETGDQHGNSAKAGDDRREPVQLPVESGERSGRDVRVTKKQAKDTRQACIDLLNSKSDNEMTDEDKVLLRQYEGAGGLGSEDASVHGTLYEFYTPWNVTKKVWEIVDKYIPGSKSVLEPSAGIGRFAEDRPNDTFTLNEYDDISSRISGILHPGADIKHGAFQEMFKTDKDYTGKKYDVVIGNPPYGKYEGIWKGRGEGKEHTRYEEYFIDRGLDTLREGGVMAFVVPSSFLRGGNDKIKEKIAGKGRLLEAWRLPNGTFNTTGVGTDIVIIRKEKGDAAQFNNNAYFGANPQMVVGDETVRTGRFGKEEKYVGLQTGVTFDQAIESINAGAVEAVPMGEKTIKEQALDGGMEIKESEAEKHKNRSEAMKGNENAKKDGGPDDLPPAPAPGSIDTLEEFNKKYNKHFDPRDLQIMRHTLWDGSIDTAKITATDKEYLVTSGNYVDIGNDTWVSTANFASGNIYQKLEEIEHSKENMSDAEYKRQKSLLEATLPAKKTVFDFTVSPISDFAEGYEIMEYQNANGQPLNGTANINAIFKNWITNELDSSSIPGTITKWDIIDYVNRKSVRAESRAHDKVAAQLEKEQTIKVRRDVAENLFNQFIREQLPIQEQERIAEKWNRQFNGTVQPDPSKIPAFVDGISRTFKGKPLKVSDIQLKGVSTLVNRGNGILAYDVGVGKTLTGVLATVSQIQTGGAKRPLICVPKAVYKNWISEIRQLFPGVKINELNNLRSLGDYKNADGSLNIPEGSLSVCTYEGLQAISFEQETIDNILMADFVSSQQSTDENDSQRKQAQELEKIRTALGKSTKSTDNSVLWEKTGFDHITVDEMHNFKNVFGEARAKEKGEANEFQGLKGGTPSDRAMKLFSITQLIQRDNNGRNVFGLTATPFTNSPIEIYNILSFVARNELKQAGIFNLHEFMAQFALLKSELAQTAKGDVEARTVMKEFKNLSALQNLINTYIDKVDGEEAGIIRPNKTPHLVDINMSDEQKAIYEDIIHYMDTADPKEDPGATLRGLNALRALTVSPALLKGSRFGKSLNVDFVASSPKMTFVCDSVTKLYKEDPKAGQVIYLPEGVEYFKDVKKYLAKQGVPEDAVAFLSPEYLPSGDKGNDRKEEIMADFNNPDGKIKIVIGSSTIKEGVNLNGNTTTLYNCMLGWNPTETVQVEGRIHRQGNKQGEVHIVYPLMNDTVDSFMYQKHYEKTKRISAVFSYKGNTLNVEDINPEELRFSLIKDPAKRADLQIKQEVEGINSSVLIAQSIADKIITTYRAREELAGDVNEYTQKISTIKQAAKEFSNLTDEDLKKRYGNKYDDEDESFDVRMDEFSGLRGSSWIEAKNAKEFRKEYERQGDEIIKYLQKQIASAKGKSETLAATLKRYNVDPDSEESAVSSSKKYGIEAAELNDKIDRIKQNRSTYIAESRRQIEEYAKGHPGKTTAQAIDETTNYIKGHLRPMEVVESEIKAKREAAARGSVDPLKKAIGSKKRVLKVKRGTLSVMGL